MICGNCQDTWEMEAADNGSPLAPCITRLESENADLRAELRDKLAQQRDTHNAAMRAQDEYWQRRMEDARYMQSCIWVIREWIKCHPVAIGKDALAALDIRLDSAGIKIDGTKK